MLTERINAVAKVIGFEVDKIFNWLIFPGSFSEFQYATCNDQLLILIADVSAQPFCLATR